MGFRFRKSFKLAPGVKLNIGKKSMGISVGGKYGGISYNTRTGTRARITAYGTGLSYSTKLEGKKTHMEKKNATTNSTQKPTGNCLMTCLKGYLYLILIPIYWIYGAIWFIFLRKKLNNNPDEKKRATTKHAIFTVLSLILFCITLNGNSNTPPTDSTTVMTETKTLTETDISEKETTENISKDVPTNQLSEEEVNATVDEITSEETIVIDAPSNEIVSGNIDSDSEQENEIYTQLVETETTPLLQDETKVIETPIVEQSVETPAEVSPTPPETSPTPVNSNSGEDNNFNTNDNPEQQNTTMTWVLNTSSKKIHYPSCKSVAKIATHNYATSNEDLDTLKLQGFDTCGNCFK